MKLKKALALALALTLALALAACGGEGEVKSVDINALASELLDAATFGEPMNALESATALGLYGCAEGTEVVAYAGTGATAEELAVFNCGTAEAADTLVKNLETRNQTRISQYSDYNPAEVPKLEKALIMSGGQYVVLLVASDTSSAEKIASDALK